MLEVNIHEAKTNLSSLITSIEEKGHSVTICRNGKPVAELNPIKTKKIKNPFDIPPDPRFKVKFLEDPTLPLDPEDWQIS